MSRRAGGSWLSRTAGLAARGRHRIAGRMSVQARVDAAWALSDGALCVDGWIASAAPGRGPIRARAVQGRDRGPWSTLLRKDRPDVAAHLFGPTGARSDLGFVGYVSGPVDPGRPVSLELRADGQGIVAAVPEPVVVDVPEEVFAGVRLEESDLTRDGLAPMTAVIRASARRRPPAASVGYRSPDGGRRPARTSVVVPIFGQFDYVPNLLAAFSRASDQVEVVLVCDDPSLAPALLEWVRQWNDAVYRARITVLVHDRNAGFAFSCNTGWRFGSSGNVLLLNSDILVDDPVADLDRLESGIAADAAAIAPVLEFPDGTLQHAGMELVVHPTFADFTLPAHPGKSAPDVDLGGQPFEAPLLSGAAILVRRDVLEAVHGVPEVFGRGDFEDVLLSLALREHGRLVVDPRVRWVHVEGASYDRSALGGVPVTLAKSVVIGERIARQA